MESTGIRLFGKKISFSERSAAGTAGEENSDGGECKYIGSDRDLTMKEEIVNIEDSEKDELKEKNSEAKPEDKSSPKSMEESDGRTNSETEGETPNSQSKSLKKPDKILPCPRCNSMDTKFCYYNNYNVSQPRHFCKSCQRYWTAGGTMRTMPVGAGRRKTKTFDGVRGIPLKVLSFASDSPHVGQENGDDCSSGSTVTTSNSVADKTQDKNGFHSQVPCIPGASWPYNPWNSAIPIPIPIPSFCPPMPFYPSPYWNYIPWMSPSMNQNAQFPCDPNSLILGKHFRDENSMNPNGCQEESKKHKNTVLIPKTLRIDDPDEAAKSSIWATLGIRNETSSKGGVFKAFQVKGEENKKSTEGMPSAVLYANPAALSRSLCFQERA